MTLKTLKSTTNRKLRYFLSDLFSRFDPHIFLEESDFFKNNFPNEILLLKGRHRNFNANQSIVFFTMRRSGSSYVSDLLIRMIKESGMTVMNLAAYYYNGGNIKRFLYRSGMVGMAINKKQGYFYGPFRFFCNGISDMDKFKIILMLRDPRDVLVSEYFSIAYSHPLPSQENPEAPKYAHYMADLREQALEMTIDKFVLDAAHGAFNNFYNYYAIYSTYIQELLNKPNVFFTKYEDMVTDFKTWLYAINDFMGINVKKDVIDQIISEADFGVDKEDIYSHKRQVTPGDHKRKLKPETIAALNIRFGSILDALGYSKE